jgi:hypothetical protein
MVFRHACLMGLEGIVAKRRDRPYRSGRCADWIKVKNRASELCPCRADRVGQAAAEEALMTPLRAGRTRLSKLLDAMDRPTMLSDAGRQVIAELTALAKADGSPMAVLDRSKGRGGPVFIALTDAARCHLVAGKLDEFLPDVFAYPAGDQRDALDEVVQHGLPSGDPNVRPLHARWEKTAPLPGDPTLSRIGAITFIDALTTLDARIGRWCRTV